jgi:hypothetical protein
MLRAVEIVRGGALDVPTCVADLQLTLLIKFCRITVKTYIWISSSYKFEEKFRLR